MSELLYIDSAIVVVNKFPGEAVETRRKDTKTIVQEWRTQLNDPGLQPLHRIDQPVGGIVILGRNKEVLADGYQLFRDGRVRREYIAIVTSAPDVLEATIEHQLAYDQRRNLSYVDTDGKKAVLSYRVIGKTKHHTVLSVSLETGRHHQIRAQLAEIGCPILGDTKYGARRPMRDRSLGLHAWRLVLPHPVTGSSIPFTAPFPAASVWRAVEEIIDPIGDDFRSGESLSH